MCYIPLMATSHFQIRKSARTLLVGLVVVALFAIVAVWYYKFQSPAIQLPRSAYSHLNFPVYFPVSPPANFTFDESSVSSTPQVLVYAFKFRGDKSVSVSIQPLDPKLDISSFRPTREINSAIGQGYLVEYDTRTTVAIVTDKSFVLINSPEGVPSSAMEQFANTLELIK
jgi:hypothetical protein